MKNNILIEKISPVLSAAGSQKERERKVLYISAIILHCPLTLPVTFRLSSHSNIHIHTHTYQASIQRDIKIYDIIFNIVTMSSSGLHWTQRIDSLSFSFLHFVFFSFVTQRSINLLCFHDGKLFLSLSLSFFSFYVCQFSFSQWGWLWSKQRERRDGKL